MSDIAVEIAGLKFVKNDFTILDNINVSIESGSYVSVVGPNGSGKTSLLKLILGLNIPTEGNIKIFGNDIKKVPSNIVAYVPQIKTLDRTFPALAIELVISGFKNKWSRIISVKEKSIALSHLAKVGAEAFAYKKLSDLSGGELQRVYLARSISKNPSILLLDEPATGIDMVCERDVNQILSEYNKNLNTTIIMVTHDWSSAYHHTNKVLLLNNHQVFFGDSKSALTEVHLQETFSHLGHKHGVSFGLKELG